MTIPVTRAGRRAGAPVPPGPLRDSLESLGGWLDRLVRPELRLFGRRVSAFLACGTAGLAAAVVLAAFLALRTGLSLGVLAMVTVTGLATFLGLALVTKVVVGREILVYYHQEVAVVTTTGLVLWLLGLPVLPYLDVTILGVGVLLAGGRIGCLLVGCCHGRPAGWGVRYRSEHAAAGFPSYLVGTRLLPVAPVEALYVLLLVAWGAFRILAGAEPGTALAFYVVAYDAGRFVFELVRGDAARVYVLGFSEAQWTSLILMIGVVAAGWAGYLPYRTWHLWATVSVAAVMLAIALGRRWRDGDAHRLLRPRHVREIAALLRRPREDAGETTGQPSLRPTSEGLRISTGRVRQAAGEVEIVTLSRADGTMTPGEARAVASVVLHLEHRSGTPELSSGREGVHHLIWPPVASG